MIVINVFPAALQLKELNLSASSSFLSGGARFYDALSALEAEDIKGASDAARRSLDLLNRAASLFYELSRKMESEYSWIAAATRSIDFAQAARSVYLSLDSNLVRDANAQIVAGNIGGLVMSFAEDVKKFSSELRRFVQRAATANLILDDEYRLAHRLLHDWEVMIGKAQYISAVCLASATVTSV